MPKITPQDFVDGLRQQSNRVMIELMSIRGIKVTSNNEDVEYEGDTYMAFPMKVTLPQIDGKFSGQAKIDVSVVNDLVLREIRSLVGSRQETKIKIARISMLADKTDVRMETDWQEFKLLGASTDGTTGFSITCSITPDFATDQYPFRNFAWNNAQ